MDYQDFGECTRVGKATIEPLRETIALKLTTADGGRCWFGAIFEIYI
ncbi:hypothetical protein HDG33_006220 [Paraburkholderia sp. Cpub6]|nr:hypothetical protein [Paraburkholderia sp. Cpub6]